MAYVRKPYAGMTSAAYYAAETRNKIFDIRDAGAYVDGSHDDTVAVQDTINACAAAGGGIVLIPDTGSACIIAGALQTNVGGINYNSQLYFPQKNFNDTDRISITIKGETTPCFTQSSGIGGAISPNKGSRLLSTLESATALSSVIGTKGAATNYLENNYNQCNVEDLLIQVTPNGDSAITLGGLNFARGANSIVKNVAIYPYNLNLVNSGVPINNCIGIAMPERNGEYMNVIQNCSVGGFESGYKTGDHCYLDNTYAIACLYGYNIGENTLRVLGSKIAALWCANDVYFSASAFVKLDLQSEWQAAVKWFSNVYTILDAGNNGHGEIVYSIADAGGFDNTNFAKSGGGKLMIMPEAFVSATSFTISGSKGGNAALDSVIDFLVAKFGAIDSTT